MTTLDDVLPKPDFSERHERHVDAPPAAVWDVVQELRIGDLALSRLLMGVRLLPARLAGRDETARMVSGRFLAQGPLPVIASDAGRSVIAGGAMQPWKLSGRDDPPALDARELRAFGEPGWVKVGFDFVLEPRAGGTRVSTETRITATDPRTRRIFGRYWLVVRVGSGLIRRDMLRAITRDAPAGCA